MDPLSVFQIILCTLGLTANLVVILIILILKEYKKTVNYWYVFNLAISDAIFLFSIPFRVAARMDGIWTFGVAGCKIVEALIFINYYASIMFLMVMSIDRYIAVCKPFSTKLQKLRKPSAAYLIAAIVWVIAILLSVPVMYYAKLENVTVGSTDRCQCRTQFLPKVNPYKNCLRISGNDARGMRRCAGQINLTEDNTCSSSSTSISQPTLNGSSFMFENTVFNLSDFFSNIQISVSNQLTPSPVAQNGLATAPKPSMPIGFQAYVFFNFIAMYLLPILLMSICYAMICQRFWKTRVATNKSSEKTNHERRRVTVVCVVLVASFTLCWLVYHAVQIRTIATAAPSPLLLRVGFTIAFLNSTLNPFLYTFLGTGCKRKMQSIRNSNAAQRIYPSKSKNTGTTSVARSKSNSKVNNEIAVPFTESAADGKGSSKV